MPEENPPLDAFILCLPESAGSALYGMVDVLSVTGTLWNELTGEAPGAPLIRPRLVSVRRTPFTCGHGIPVHPEVTIGEVERPEIVIVPEMWLAPDDAMSDRYADLKDWLRRVHADGAIIYSACSGSVLLAASGLLDGREATSHWGYADLFRRAFPSVRFDPAPTLCVGDPAGRIVTAGGTSSWHDLAIHIIARHASPGEALQIAKVYLMKWHTEGQLPFASLVRRVPHADSVVRQAEAWLTENPTSRNPVAGAVEACGIPERSLKRRFKAATGTALITYSQNLRIERAKRALESEPRPIDEIASEIGYENPAFFRRLFKRCTGLTPGAYRKLFRPILQA
ncbi:MAG: helix-turn-helix domain-containing protein [Hyphomicrobiales bacterium]|nr:helix-turn-helix domain-containing protein [Hyphomicrobiales bacterium]